jgi:hypothetical protein
VVKGMSNIPDKQRRAQRRKNHIHKDLATPKYHQRVVWEKSVEDEQARRIRRYGIEVDDIDN